MDLIGLPDGSAGGGHLGVTHMLKHYLNPSEVWEDLVAQGAQVRPWELLDRFAWLAPPVWLQWKRPGEALREQWNKSLIPAYRGGYLAVVQTLARPLSNPGSKDWFRIWRGWLIVTSQGVLILVSDVHADGSAKLRTAFRPLPFPRKNHRSAPMDPESRRLREKVAHEEAMRRAIDISGGRR